MPHEKPAHNHSITTYYILLYQDITSNGCTSTEKFNKNPVKCSRYVRTDDNVLILQNFSSNRIISSYVKMLPAFISCFIGVSLPTRLAPLYIFSLSAMWAFLLLDQYINSSHLEKQSPQHRCTGRKHFWSYHLRSKSCKYGK